MLNELEQDILNEQINLFVGQAASFLSEMIDRRIVLSIPSVKLITRPQIMASTSFYDLEGYLLSSVIDFGEQVQGKAQLVFESSKVKQLIAMCMGEPFTDDDPKADFLDQDLDVIREIGNVILNAVVGGFGNLLETRITYDVPNIYILQRDDIINQMATLDDTVLLMMDLVFNVQDSDVKGMIVCAMNIESIERLRQTLQNLGDGLYG